ncbi:MAG: hypothetical protein M3P04_00775 [Actinomycetota bacterium]|nr:hypothetical protein [Actinomycetota bacterium]
MSLHDSARVTVLLADYIAVDAAGKLTAVGAAFTLSGLQPDGHTPPVHVAVLVDVPGDLVGQDFALGVGLVDDATGRAVLLPGADGGGEPLRVAQVVQAQTPSVPGMLVPSTAPGRVQLILGFPQGLPLEAGHSYRWAVELDGQTRPQWSAWFHVPSPAPGPVFGGPVGPTSIPNL